jgi:Ca2+-binding RTX toxin-like protein
MTLTGGDGNDTLAGSFGDDTISGGNGSDTLSGAAGSDALTGGSGDDTLTPGVGDDNTVDGGADTDTVSYDDGRGSGVTVTLNDGSAGNDGGSDDGSAGNREAVIGTESLIGSARADTLTGDGAFNTIQGRGGDDEIRGGIGQDSLEGEDGTDTADYGDHAAAVTVALDASGFFKNGSSGENDRTTGFEAARGGAGADTLTSGYPAGNPVRLEGALGNDTLTGGPSDDTLVGDAGSDVVDGQGGTDTALYPVADAVTVTLNNGAVKDDGGPNDGAPGARDSIATENVTGGSGPDSLIGDGGANRILGGDGDDSIQGGLGRDDLSGGPGVDEVSYEERASSQPVEVSVDGVVNDGAAGESDVLAPDFEIVAGGSGADRLTATAAAGVELIGNSGDDELFAPNGGGTADGGNGNDVITGGDGVDSLDGGLGDDTIDGLGGADQVLGGGGNDSIEARDGAVDAVDCGTDTDTALTDPADSRTGCELPAAPATDGGSVQQGGGAPAGGAPAGGGAPAVVQQRDPERILVIFGFAFRKSTAAFTKFDKLQVKAVPIGSTVSAVCLAPKGKKCPAKSFKKKNAFGTVNLSKWVNRKLPAGTRLTVTVTKPGAFIGAVKTLTVAKKKSPTIGTRCLPPGAAKPVGC